MVRAAVPYHNEVSTSLILQPQPTDSHPFNAARRIISGYRRTQTRTGCVSCIVVSFRSLFLFPPFVRCVSTLTLSLSIHSSTLLLAPLYMSFSFLLRIPARRRRSLPLRSRSLLSSFFICVPVLRLPSPSPSPPRFSVRLSSSFLPPPLHPPPSLISNPALAISLLPHRIRIRIRVRSNRTVPSVFPPSFSLVIVLPCFAFRISYFCFAFLFRISYSTFLTSHSVSLCFVPRLPLPSPPFPSLSSVQTSLHLCVTPFKCSRSRRPQDRSAVVCSTHATRAYNNNDNNNDDVVGRVGGEGRWWMWW